jgi:hypothetical protein
VRLGLSFGIRNTFAWAQRAEAAWRALFFAIAGHAMSDALWAADLFDVDWDHCARLILFIADDLDRLIEGGQAA